MSSATRILPATQRQSRSWLEATRTSDFEGACTSTPTQWSGSFTENLLAVNWTLSENPPGSAIQFNNSDDALMMFVAGIALMEDADYL